jgi:hypothetical protein
MKTGRSVCSGRPVPFSAGKLGRRISGDRDHDRGRPNRDRSATGGRLHPTNDGTHSSSVRELHAGCAEHCPLAGCSSRDAPRLRAVCDLPWRCAAGTCRNLRRKPEALPRMPASRGVLQQLTSSFGKTSSLPFEPSLFSPSFRIPRLEWGGVPFYKTLSPGECSKTRSTSQTYVNKRLSTD